MCNGSEAGSYLRPVDFVHHSSLGLRVVKKKRRLLKPEHSNVQRFRGGLVFKAHRLCESLNSRFESNKEKEEELRLHAMESPSITEREGNTLKGFNDVHPKKIHKRKRKTLKPDRVPTLGSSTEPHF